MDADTKRWKLTEICKALLETIGENPSREGLRATPDRFARWWMEFLTPHEGELQLTSFDSVAVDQMVVARGIEVWSLCEHHLLPFRCRIAVGYLTGTRVLGLSKIPRLCRHHAAGLQIQERLVAQIRESMEIATGVPDVAVIAEGEHLCTMMRGVRLPVNFITSSLGGKFREEEATRAEFMRLAGLGDGSR